MRVLVACEESQEVCKAFRARGHEAYSCDLQECSGGHPEWHIHDDVMKVLNPSTFPFGYPKIPSFRTADGEWHDDIDRWDLIIAHPPCTYISNAGARWLYAGGQLNEDRYQKGLAGKAFFMRFLEADCPRIAVENPIPSSVFGMPPCTQIIQPFEYGEPWSKKTCLWLIGLPPLTPTDIVQDHKPYCSSGSYSRGHDPKYKGHRAEAEAQNPEAKLSPASRQLLQNSGDET